tara:strand:- start:464 stop:676 length:213 start_codon:yes stop_codon:yes gene_type:complete
MAFKMEGFSGFKKHPLYGKLDAEEKKRYDSLDKTAREIIDGNETLSQLKQALITKKELKRQQEQRQKETG